MCALVSDVDLNTCWRNVGKVVSSRLCCILRVDYIFISHTQFYIVYFVAFICALFDHYCHSVMT